MRFQVTATDPNGDGQPIIYSYQSEHEPQFAPQAHALIRQMLTGESKVYIIETYEWGHSSDGDEVEERLLTVDAAYAMFAGHTLNGRKLRVVNRDQSIDEYRFFVYVVPAEANGPAIIDLPAEVEL